MKHKLTTSVAGILVMWSLSVAHGDAIDEMRALNTNRIGFMDLHPLSSINVKLNAMARTIPPETLMQLTQSVTSYAGFTHAMLRAAAEAEEREAWLEAALYYRGAEFYMTENREQKVEVYKKFIELHDRGLPRIAALRARVPYEDGYLPVLDIPARRTQIDTIVGNSGFDGLIEEMVPAAEMLAEAGYRVILFEGPGQGGALRLHSMPMTREWEKPFGAVLDHFEVNDCIALGASLGGYLAPRAAAYESRISRVIAWGAMYDFADCFARAIGDGWQPLMQQLEAGNDHVVNQLITQAIQGDEGARWGIHQGMHVSGSKTPSELFRWLLTMNLKDESPLIKQDTLIVMGADDQLVPFNQVYQQAAALTGARSVTTRTVSSIDQGGEHCQIGNREIVIHEILRWLHGLRYRDGQQTRLKDNLVTDPAVR